MAPFRQGSNSGNARSLSGIDSPGAPKITVFAECASAYDAGMGKCFRSDELNQTLLLPPSLHDWLPEKHLARFLVDVVEALDLGAIQASYDEKDGRGQAAYAPAMMVRVLLYGYCTGTYSSRKIQAKTYDDVAFRYLAADEHPDHSTLAETEKKLKEEVEAMLRHANAVDAAEDEKYGKGQSGDELPAELARRESRL